MTTGAWRVCAIVALLSALAITSSRAADLNVPNLGSSLAIDPKDVRQSDTAESGQVGGDDASRITDLESTRAALDRRAGPALSLSVTGGLPSK